MSTLTGDTNDSMLSGMYGGTRARVLVTAISRTGNGQNKRKEGAAYAR
jgi:hypothetical protein